MSPDSAKAVSVATRIGFLMIVEEENYYYSWKTACALRSCATGLMVRFRCWILFGLLDRCPLSIYESSGVLECPTRSGSAVV